MRVVDASAILEVLLQTDAAAEVEEHLFGSGTLHAPHLLDLEVAQVLRRSEKAGELSPRRGREALDDLSAFRIERYAHTAFLSRIWSMRDHATAHDACYLALAEVLEAPLVTRDRRLAALPGHGAAVEVIA